MKIKLKKTLHIIILGLITLLLVAGIYSIIEFKLETIEEYFFYATNGIGSSDFSMVVYAIKNYGLIFLLIFLLLINLFYNPFKIKETKYYPIKLFVNHKKIWTIVIGVIFSAISLQIVKTPSYIYQNIKKSEFFEENYVELEKEDITFTNKKKNLIMIYIESLETTFFDKQNGGDWKTNIIPELDEIRKDNDAIYFSSDELGRGTENLYGTTYTTASVIANSSSIPFKTPILYNKFNNKTYFNGVYTIGDVLKDNGYHNEIISPAKLEFGALDNFFKKHGSYDIIDPDTLSKYNYKMDKNDEGKWGFNDKYMFEIAKDRITKLSESNQPFNLTMIGIDTHPVDGFTGDYTTKEFKNAYENTYATEAKLINDFINWFKTTDTYKDTVVVIIGDHLCMQTKFVGDHDLKNRGRYNVIINSSVTTDNTKNRSFTAVDTTPTVLASLGASIKGNKMGIGTNLFSDEQTITEKYGLNKVNSELKNASDLYNELIKEK